MRIDHLHVQNFRCFKQHEFRFHPEFNVFVGKNGAGKTALLEAAVIAVGTWLRGIRSESAPTIGRTDPRLVAYAYGSERAYEEQFPVHIRADALVSGSPVRWSRSLKSATGKTTWADADSLTRIAEQFDRRVQEGDAAVVLPVLAYYGAGRLWEQMSDTERRRGEGHEAKVATSRRSGYADALDRRVSGAQFSWWMERQDRISYERGEPTPLYRAVRQAAAGMLEDVRDVRYDPRLVSVVAEFSNGRLLPFDRLSAGTRSMLALAGDLAMRMVQLNLPLGEAALRETPGVVLIDEVELHLHPTWQRGIVADLRRTFPRIQFLTTTHSPQVISEVPPDQVQYLIWEGEELTVKQRDQSYGLDTNWILEFLMGASPEPTEPARLEQEIEGALDAEDFRRAHQLIDDLRTLLGGDTAKVARLQGSLTALEALSDEDDS